MSFWSQFAQADCLPDKCQCEVITDGLIRQTSSFWSSFAYVFAGIAIYRYIDKKSFELKLWSIICCFMGFSSLFGHGSYIKFALAMDFAAIVVVMSFFGIYHFMQSLRFSVFRMFLFLLVYYIGLYYVMYWMDKWTKVGICSLIFFFAVADVVRKMGWTFLKSQTFQATIISLFVSFGFFIIDELHIGCDPDSLMQWHSVWHFGSAASMFLYGKWRFEEVEVHDLSHVSNA